MSKELFDEVAVVGTEYKRGDWKQYAVHDDNNVKGFFGPYRFLGNFEGCPVLRENGNFAPSPEHAYQLSKEITSVPSELDPRIMRIQDSSPWVNTLSAKEAKRWGNNVKLRPDWEKIKYDIMARLVFDKFYRHKELRAKLIDTGEKFLEETNHWHDNTWGNCICSKCQNIQGKNWLGIILMKTREFWK